MSQERWTRGALIALVALGGIRSAAAQGDVVPEEVARAAEARAAQAERAEAEAAEAAVDAVLADPGDGMQLCFVRCIDERTEFRAYGFMRGESRVSADRFERLRPRRAAVIDVVRRRLEATDGLPADRGRSYTALDSWGHLLAIAIDLNAADVLPVLLAALERVDDDERDGIVRGMLLSTMSAILRQERWPALLASEIETAYRARLAKLARVPRTGVKRWTVYGTDPITGLGRVAEDGPGVPVERHRDEVVRWCRELLARSPAERLGARGMDPEPINR